MKNAFRSLLKDDRGATLVEYGLLLLLIALAAISSLTLFGGKVSSMYSNEAAEV